MTDSLSQDPLTGKYSLIAPTTSKKPYTHYTHEHLPTGTHPCPFCSSQDHATNERETSRRSRLYKNQYLWTSRALLNLYPLTPPSSSPPFHEVLILSPKHDAHISSMSTENLIDFWDLSLERFTYYEKNSLVPNWYLNHGRLAGASQPHPHAQILGLTNPSALQLFEQASTATNCVLCQKSSNILISTDTLDLFVPDVANCLYELRISPQTHIDTPDPLSLATMSKLALSLLERTFGQVAYNLVLHAGHYSPHWHVHIYPRLNISHNGLELGSDIAIITKTTKEQFELFNQHL